MKTGLIVTLALVMGLSACGRKSPPRPPDDAIYPLQYPHRNPGDGGPIPSPDDSVSETNQK